MVVPRSAVCVPLYLSRPLGSALNFVSRGAVPSGPTTIIRCSPSSFFAKCTMRFRKSAGRTSTRSARPHSYSSVLTLLPRYIIRDFQYSADQIEKEQEELQTANTAEKELWVSSPAQSLLVKQSLINCRRSSFGFQRSTFRRLSKP